MDSTITAQGENKANYWVVGASWGGHEHQDEKFVAGGYWMLGWGKEDQPVLYERASQMQPGDRIAIKRMKGKGQTGILIMHIGIIKEVILEVDKIICTVNWAAKNISRNIEESKGCFASIHGPFAQDAWTNQVFSL